jgi:autotransporter-associated beta strand protein
MNLVKPTLLMVVVLVATTPPTNAATKVWHPQLLGFHWSNPDNWSPLGVPVDGDDLQFEARPVGDGSALMINDLTNLAIRSLSFRVVNNDAPTTYDWTLSGNELTVTDAISTDFSLDEDVYIRCPIRLGGNAQLQAGPGSEFFPSVGLHLDSPIDLNGHNLWLVEHYFGGDLDVSGVISGNGNLNIVGGVELEGENGNTFNGSVFLNDTFELGGTELTLDKISGPAVPGPLVVSNHCVVKLQRPHQIADTTTVTLHPGGGLRLDGHTETVAGLSMAGNNSGAARVDTGDATLSVNGDITAANNGTNGISVIAGKLGLPPGSHVITTTGNQDWALSIEAKIIGDGGFTKMGSKGLLLSGDSSFNGDAMLLEGAVDVSHANGLGSPVGATILAGTELDVRDAAIGTETLLVNSGTYNGPLPGARLLGLGTCSWAGPVVLNTNLSVAGWDLVFVGPISGPGGMAFSGFIQGAGTPVGTVRLSGSEANTYSGPTLALAPLLEFDKPSGVPAFGGSLTVGNGGGFNSEVRWLQNYQKIGADVTILSDGLVNLNHHSDDFGPITFTGGTISTGTGELGVYGLVTVKPFAGSATIDGRLGLPPGVHEFRVGDGAALIDLGVNAVVVGSGHLRKTGDGQMWLNSSNSYAGVTFVDQGALVAFNADALGAASSGTSVKEGASLILNATGTTVREPIALKGSGDGSHGALDVFGAITLRNPFPSLFACLDLTTNATIRVEPGGVLTADGFISGVGPLTKAGPGTLVFANANANTYSGDTLVREGALELRKPNFVVGVPGDLVTGPAPFNSSALVRFFQNGGMTAGARATVNAGSLLDLNGYGQTLSRLDLNDGGDAQTGPGLLSFPVGGLVAVGSLSQLGSHASSYLSGNLGLPANATLTFAVGAYAPTAPFDFSPELEMFAQIAPPAENPNFERAGIAKTGPGTMKLTANNSFNGRVDVSEGTLLAAGSSVLGSTFDGTFVLNNATLALQGDLTVTDEILVLNSSAAQALYNLAGANIWAGRIIMNRSSTVRVADATVLALSGAISGTGNFTKVGAGTLSFIGADPNAYNGETFINEGLLILNKPFVVTAVPGPLSVGTTAGAATVVRQFNGYQIVGDIFVNRHGLLDVSGQEENVGHLWLYEGGDVQTGPGTLYLKTGGSIRAFPGTDGDPSTISGNLGLDPGQHDVIVARGNSPGAPELVIDALVSQPLDTAGLRKTGDGTLRLTANNAYSGGTVVAAGILQADGSQLGAGVSVYSGAQLMGNGRVGHVDYVSLGGPAGVVSPGHSPGIFSCANFNLGGVGGTLRIELNGTTPGANGYDQLYSRGALSFVTLDGVTLDASLGFASAVNNQFTIIRKDGVRLVTGEFVGLPEGTNFYIGGELFTITYVGGDGNDVVLTRLSTPPKPVLSIEQVSPVAVRLFWPASFTDYSLQFSTNFSSPGWTATLPPPVITGTNSVVTNSSSGGPGFYRLSKP